MLPYFTVYFDPSLQVLDSSRNDWWLVVCADSESQGWVPANYLEQRVIGGPLTPDHFQDPTSPPPDPFEDETGEIANILMKYVNGEARAMLLLAETKAMVLLAETRAMVLLAETRAMETRAMVLLAETRAMVLLAETRAMVLLAETRAMVLLAQTRAMVLLAQTRAMAGLIHP